MMDKDEKIILGHFVKYESKGWKRSGDVYRKGLAEVRLNVVYDAQVSSGHYNARDHFIPLMFVEYHGNDYSDKMIKWFKHNGEIAFRKAEAWLKTHKYGVEE